MYPHRIRLHGPWDCEPIATRDQVTLPSPRRMVPPGCLRDCGLAGFVGRVLLRRRFGYPGRIDSYEHVWLIMADVVGRAKIDLNGQTLGIEQTGEIEFDITGLLEARNRLEIVLDAEGDDAGLIGAVGLEIRRDAFLRNIVALHEKNGAIHVTGLVVGQSAVPLELYGRADGKNVFYSVIGASTAGKPFDIAFASDAFPAQIQVELVCGAERWHAIETPVSRVAQNA
jgi:hypothetical protein